MQSLRSPHGWEPGQTQIVEAVPDIGDCQVKSKTITKLKRKRTSGS